MRVKTEVGEAAVHHAVHTCIYCIYVLLIPNVILGKAGGNLVFESSSHMFTSAGLNGVCEICHFCLELFGERSNPVRL